MSPHQRVGRRASEREGRSRREPSPFGLRNRSRSRSRSKVRGDGRDPKSSKSKVKKNTAQSLEKSRSKDSKNDMKIKTKRSSEIVVNKDKLAENERKLNENAHRDQVEMEEKMKRKQEEIDDISRHSSQQSGRKNINNEEIIHSSKSKDGASTQHDIEENKTDLSEVEAEENRQYDDSETKKAEKVLPEQEDDEAENLGKEEKQVPQMREVSQAEKEPMDGSEKDSLQNSMISAEDSDEVSEMTDPTYDTRISAKRKSPVHMEAISENAAKGRQKRDGNYSPKSRKSPVHEEYSKESSVSPDRESKASTRSPRSRSPVSKSSASMSTNTRSRSPTGRSVSTASRSASPTKFSMSRRDRNGDDSKDSSYTRSKSPENSYPGSFQSSTTSGSKHTNEQASWNPDTFTGKENFIASVDSEVANEARSPTDPFDDPFYPVNEEKESKGKKKVNRTAPAPGKQISMTNLSFEDSDQNEDGDALSYGTPANSESTEIHNNVSPPPRRVSERKPRLPHQSSTVPKIDARNGFLGIDEASGEVTLNVDPEPESVPNRKSNLGRSEGAMGSFSQRALNSRSPRSHIPGVKLKSSPNNARGFIHNESEASDDKYVARNNSRKSREHDNLSQREKKSRQRDLSISPERSSVNEGRSRGSPERSIYSSRSKSQSISPERTVYSSRSKSKSVSPERRSESRKIIHSPSFILDRREKRRQREADLEKKAKYIRSQVKALERRRSDFYSIAQERGRRREKVMKSAEGISAQSPTRPRTYSPDKLKRALVDERDMSPMRALVESSSRSPTRPEDRRARSPIKEEDSWFERPDYNTREIRAASRERARARKKKQAFKAPPVFSSGSTRGIQFQAPEAYTRRTDPVLASVAHIKDPIQRAGAMILSAAAIPVQTEIRRYLAVKEREDRTWAIIVVQAYFRRWKAELARYKYLYCATRIQAAFRGWLVRDTMEDKHYCATQIQKIARGYLATMKVYEDLYNITVVQSIVRRNLAIKQAEKRYSDIIIVQSVARGWMCRKEMGLLHSSATKIQTNWRAYTCQMNYQFDVVDIIIVQSIARKRAAQKLAELLRQEKDRNAAITIQKYWRSYDCTMNYLHAVADILIVQSVVRRWIAKRFAAQYRKDLHFKMALRIQMLTRSWLAKARVEKQRAAINIQKTWRGFWCYTDYVFTLADIIVVQRTVRSHLAYKKVNAMRKARQEETEIAAAVSIQKYWRGYTAQMNMLFSLVHIIIVQVSIDILLLRRFQCLRKHMTHHSNSFLLISYFSNFRVWYGDELP